MFFLSTMPSIWPFHFNFTIEGFEYKWTWKKSLSNASRNKMLQNVLLFVFNQTIVMYILANTFVWYWLIIRL